MLTSNSHHYALIMAGGSGTRLWPMSRASLPKQFQPLLGTQTPFQHMIELITQVIPLEKVFVMAVPEFTELILSQAPGLPRENILLEPGRRDNGPAITFALLQIEQRDPEATVAILWSDHRIARPAAFEQALNTSLQASTENPDSMVIIGAKPTRPDTNLGYLEMSEMRGRYNGIATFTATRFIEKPDLPTAKRFASSWEYLWNVGYSVIPVRTFFQKFAEIQPDLMPVIAELRNALGGNAAESYEKLPKMSIDYLFTQKMTNLLAVPADMGWSDIGTWNILQDVLSEAQETDVIIQGPVTHVATHNSLIFAKDRPITTVGLQNIIVVDTGDAILVLDRNADSAHMKELITTLQTTHPELL